MQFGEADILEEALGIIFSTRVSMVSQKSTKQTEDAGGRGSPAPVHTQGDQSDGRGGSSHLPINPISGMILSKHLARLAFRAGNTLVDPDATVAERLDETRLMRHEDNCLV